MPLAQLQTPKGKWSYSLRYLEMKAAKAWGVIPPSRFYQFSKLDQAVMIEFVLENEQMAAYQSEVDRAAQEDHMRNLETSRKPGRR